MDYAIRTVPTLFGGDDSKLDVKGVYSFTVENTGLVAATLWDVVVIQPNQGREFPSVANLPYAEDVKLSWASSASLKQLLVVKNFRVEK